MNKKALKTRLPLNRLARFLSLNRHFLNGTCREYGIIAIIFFILTAIYTNFVVFHLGSQVFVSGPSDATAGFMWLNFADPGINPFLAPSTLVSFPAGEQLGGATFITYLALWVPIRLLSFIFGAVGGINAMMFLGFVGGAITIYWLIKRLTGSILASSFAGIAAAFVPYNLYNSSAHIAYIFFAVFVCMLAAFIALWLRPTKKRAVLFGATIALAFYTDGYYLLIASVMTAGLIIAGLLFAIIHHYHWADYKKRLIVAFIALGSLLVLMVPIGVVQLTQGSQIKTTLGSSRSDIGDEIKLYQTKMMDFILPSPTNPIYKHFPGAETRDNYKNLRSNPTESMTYVGFTVIVLDVVGLVLLGVYGLQRKQSSLERLNRNQRKVFTLLGMIVLTTTPLFLSFMLSPTITIHGHVIDLPGQFLIDHNIALWRVLARFFIPLHVVLVVFAAYSLWVVVTISKVMQRRKWLAIAFICLCTLVVVAEYMTGVYRPSFDFSKAPESYVWLSKQKDIKTIAELPFVDPLDEHTTNYITYQIVHHKNIIDTRNPGPDRLNNTLGSVSNPEAVDFAYERGAQAIVTHDLACEQTYKWGNLIHQSADVPAGKVCVYRLLRPDTNDKLFAVYGDGFKFYPNQPAKLLELASFDKRDAALSITDDLFRKDETGQANLTASIHDFHNNQVNGTWEVVQSGKVISAGIISDSNANISAIVNAAEPVHIRLAPAAGSLLRPNDLYLSDLVVTSVHSDR